MTKTPRLESAREVLRQHAHLFRRAYIFGSVARGEDDEWSDVDVILVRETELPFTERAREVLPLAKALLPVDLLIYTPAELRSLRRTRAFVREAVEKGIRVEGEQKRGAKVARAGEG